jgi:hypothetical protein
MFAMVARGDADRTPAAGRWFALPRVTHALLFMAASIVSPGVRSCCAGSGCGSGSADTSCCAAGVACCSPAEAAGACCAPAASDTAPNGCSSGAAGGSCGCRCDDGPAAPLSPAPPRDPGPTAALALPAPAVVAPAREPGTATAVPAPAAFFVDRPVRVRFGVWID